MYEQANTLKQEEKTPIHIEKANELFQHFGNYSHEEQVDMFKHIQSRLVKVRQEQIECRLKEHEITQMDIQRHQEGTKIIASGL